MRVRKSWLLINRSLPLSPAPTRRERWPTSMVYMKSIRITRSSHEFANNSWLLCYTVPIGPRFTLFPYATVDFAAGIFSPTKFPFRACKKPQIW